uniref:aggregation-promoting factor n=1 Tax=uncultured Streptococcus sp. TaxID=83427 RepID=UPI0028ED0C2C
NNHIDNIHLIYVGQELVIAGPVAPAATPAPTTYAAPAAQDETVSAPVVETPVAEETVASTETSAPAATVSGSEAEAKEWIAQKESGGSYTATNGRYIGRYQLTDSYLNGDYSAENQERVADAYVAGRYGSWTAAKNFWLNNGWY